MKDIDLSFASFIPSLLKSVPELVPLYQEHITDNFNELLPHVFFGEVTRFVVSNYKARQNLEALKRIFDFLDRGINSKDEKLQELISVSFLENLLPEEGEEECFHEIKNLLSKSLQTELKLYE